MKKYILLPILIIIGLLIVPVIAATGPPSASFSWGIIHQSTSETTVQFCSTASSGVTSWNWIFGDGHTSVGDAPVNIYSVSGNYNVLLTVENPTLDTKTFTYSQTITIPAIVIPTATPTIISTPIPETNSFGDIYIGESGLDVSSAINPTSTYIGWWSPGANIYSSSSDTQIAILGRQHTLTVSQSEFATHLGKWYNLDISSRPISVAFNVVDPYLELQLWNNDANIEITSGKVARGTNVGFKIDTNMYSFPKRTPTPTPISIRVIASNGAEYTQLFGGSGVSLRHIPITSSPISLNSIWDTDYIKDGVNAYNTNEYTIYAESDLNSIRNNYDRIGKTISTTRKLSIIDSSLSMKSNSESITRGNSFTVSIIGKPITTYHLWVTKTNGMGVNTSSPPKISINQEGVKIGEGGNHIGSSGVAIKNDVPSLDPNNPFYANVTTSTSGTRTIAFATSVNTKDQKYTIRIEEDISYEPKYDEIQISIGGGGISILSAGGPTYYLGELIKLSGTNTESTTTYLYIYGPNLNTEGAQIHLLNPRNGSVINDDPSTFKQIPVNGDGTWSWSWSTSSMALDAGTYIIYAVSQPKSRSHIIDAAYATTSISFGKPTLSATVSQKNIAKGDTLRISGYAEGNPINIAIWIMGKNYALRDTVSVNGAEFYYDLDRIKTASMAAGQYYVIIQHPMQNNKFDVYLNGDGSVINLMLGNTSTGGTKIFQFTGSGSLQGTDAANALISAIDDVNIDDMYTKLLFTIAEPFLTIDDIGLVYVGERITITGRTNLIEGTNLLIDINPLAFKPTNKSDSNLFTSNAIVTVPVIKGGDYNKFSATIDFSTFKPDEYLITTSAIGNTLIDTSTFVISGDVRPNAPRSIVTPKVNTTTAIPTISIASTPIPTPIPTTNKPVPGYGAVLALVGLIIVSTIISFRK